MQDSVEAQPPALVDKQSAPATGLQSFSLYNIAFSVADINKSIKWYRDVFGFRLISRSVFTVPAGQAEAAIIFGGGLYLELVHVPGAKRIDEMFAEVPLHLLPIGNKFIVLQVDDIITATKELEEKGVTFVWREQYLVDNSMLSTMIEDIDGNKINIFQTNTIIGKERMNDPVDAEKIIKDHLSIWSDPNETERRTAIGKIYADDIKLVDPFFAFNGIEKMNGFINDLQVKYPGYIFSTAGNYISHHNIIKFDWNFGPENDPKKITGTDVMVLENARIKTLYIFINNMEKSIPGL